MGLEQGVGSERRNSFVSSAQRNGDRHGKRIPLRVLTEILPIMGSGFGVPVRRAMPEGTAETGETEAKGSELWHFMASVYKE